MADFYIRQGDTASAIRDVLRDEDGIPVAINSATVTLTLVPLRGGPALVDAGAADNLDDGTEPNRGAVRFDDWTTLLTAEPGSYLGSWTVTFLDGRIETFPNAGYIAVEITPDAPLAAGRYITVEELKKTLKLEGRQYADRDIEIAIAAAADALDEHYGGPWTLGSAHEARLFTPTHKKSAIELRPPLVELDDVKLDDAGGGTYSTTLVQGTDFELERADVVQATGPWDTLRILRSGFAWDYRYWPQSNPYPWGVDALRVTGRWGWTTVPAGVKTASTIIATRLVRRTREAPFGIVGLGPEGTTIRAGAIALDPEIAFVMRGGAGKGPGAMRTILV